MGDTEDVKIVLDGAPKGFREVPPGLGLHRTRELIRASRSTRPHNLVDGNGGFGGTVKIDTKGCGRPVPPARASARWPSTAAIRTTARTSTAWRCTATRAPTGPTACCMPTAATAATCAAPTAPFAYSRNNQRSLLAKVNLYPDDAQTITLSAMRSNAAGWQPFAAKRDDLPAPSQADIDRYGLTGSMAAQLVHRDQLDQNYSAKWNIAPIGPSWVNLTLAYARSDTRQRDRRSSRASQSAFLGTLGNKSWVDYRDDRFDLSNESHVALGTAGACPAGGPALAPASPRHASCTPPGRRADYNHGYFQPHYMPSGTQTVRSLYLQDAVTVGGLTVTPGVRYDHVANTGRPNDAPRYNNPAPWPDMTTAASRIAGWTPHLGVVWKAARSVALFADASRTWRAPVIDEQYEVQYAKSMCRAAAGRCGPSASWACAPAPYWFQRYRGARRQRADTDHTVSQSRQARDLPAPWREMPRSRAEGGAASDLPQALVQLPQPARLHHRRAGTGDLLRQPGDVRQPVAFGHARAPRRLAARSMGTAHLDRRDPAGLRRARCWA